MCCIGIILGESLHADVVTCIMPGFLRYCKRESEEEEEEEEEEESLFKADAVNEEDRRRTR
jgi:hypothetical protein